MNLTNMSIVVAKVFSCAHHAKFIFVMVCNTHIKPCIKYDFLTIVTYWYLFSIRSYGQFKKTAILQQLNFHANRIVMYGTLQYPKNSTRCSLSHDISHQSISCLVVQLWTKQKSCPILMSWTFVSDCSATHNSSRVPSGAEPCSLSPSILTPACLPPPT